MKHKQKFTFADLEPDAREFIERKVKRLGSLGAVRRDYKRDDLVSRYAVAFAQGLWPEKQRRQLTL